MPFEGVELVNQDVDEAKIIVGKVSGNTTEAGGEAYFSVRLSSKPRENVTLHLHSDNPNEGSIDKSKLEFTQENWGKNQVITITGIDDFIKDEDALFRIIFSPSVSKDGHYHGLTPKWVQLKNLDSRKLTFGSLVLYQIPFGDFKEDFDANFGLSVSGGYILNKNVSLKLMVSSISFTGKPQKELYGKNHMLEHTLDLLTVFASLKAYIIKKPILLFFDVGMGIINWSYNSTTLTDGTQQSSSGQDFDIGAGVGVEVPIYQNLFFQSLLAQHVLTGGLGNRRATSLGAGVYYPF